MNASEVKITHMPGFVFDQTFWRLDNQILEVLLAGSILGTVAG